MATVKDRTLVMDNLPDWAEEGYLFQLLSPTNAVIAVKMSRQRSQQGGRHAFIEFTTREAALGVMQAYNGTMAPTTDMKLSFHLAADYTFTRTQEFSAFAGDLAPEVLDSDLLQAFQKYYPSVFEAKVVTNPGSTRSKGFGFVRFSNEAERDRAITEMQGYSLFDRPLRLSLATAKSRNGERTDAHEPSVGPEVTQGDFDPTNTTLFVGGLAQDVTEPELTSLFVRFGQLIYVRIPPGKKCGFVQFYERQAAVLAMQTLHGHPLHGASLRLSWGKNAARSSSSIPARGAPPAAYTPPAVHTPHEHQAAWDAYAHQQYAQGYQGAWTGYEALPQGVCMDAYGGWDAHANAWGVGGGYTEADASEDESSDPVCVSQFGRGDPRDVDVAAENKRYCALVGAKVGGSFGRLAFLASSQGDALPRGLLPSLRA